jgi:serine/threonine protein kinase
MLMAIKFDPPQISSRYQIEGLLGSGSLGQVYRARDNMTGQTVALKQLAEHDQAAAEQEFQLLAELDHPGIIKVYDHSLNLEGRPFLAIEYLDGAVDIVTGSQEKPLQQKLDFLTQMMQALAYLHSKHILHRDLKPANVLVSQGRVKLLDFGLSLDYIPEEHLLQGTAAYLAPELYQGSAPSEASDVYACGIIAYECLAGRHPFHTVNMNRLMLDILYEEPDIDSLPLDPDLHGFLRGLLARDPRQRPSAAEAAQELDNIQLKTENGMRELERLPAAAQEAEARYDHETAVAYYSAAPELFF